MLQVISNFIIGACLASHAGIIYDRYDIDDTIFLRSKCTSCSLELSMLDEIPIISYLLLNGKCRYCQNEIPIHLFIIEFIGTISFINLDLSQSSLFEFAFRFFLLLISIFDYYEKEFPTIFLAPLITIALNQFDPNLKINIIFALPAAFVMLISVIHGKIGSGDLFIYLILSVHYGARKTNMIFLLASIFFITTFYFERNDEITPFLPYIYAATILINLL